MEAFGAHGKVAYLSLPFRALMRASARGGNNRAGCCRSGARGARWRRRRSRPRRSPLASCMCFFTTHSQGFALSCGTCVYRDRERCATGKSRKFTIYFSPYAAKSRKNGASVIDTLVNLKIRLDSVRRMTQIQNTSRSFAETKYLRVAAREDTLAPPGRHRPRHSRMSLTSFQSIPAIDAAIYRPYRTLYQLQPSFHPQSTEPEPTARARRAGEEFY